MHFLLILMSCTSYYEGTELKANHNIAITMVTASTVVLAITKVLNWKLITTFTGETCETEGCTSYYEGTELKANHNGPIGAIAAIALY